MLFLSTGNFVFLMHIILTISALSIDRGLQDISVVLDHNYKIIIILILIPMFCASVDSIMSVLIKNYNNCSSLNFFNSAWLRHS